MKKTLRKLLFVFLLFFALFVTGCNNPQVANKQNSDPVDKIQPAKQEAALEIIFSSDKKREFTLPVDENSTAYSVLVDSALPLDVKKYDFGTLVNSIDGVSGGADGKYWIYYINGKSGTVASDAAPILAGDTLSWRLEDKDTYNSK